MWEWRYRSIYFQHRYFIEVRVVFVLDSFTVYKTTPGTHRVEGWVCPNTGTDVLEKGKMFCICWELKP
jgi:hypothetical protein